MNSQRALLAAEQFENLSSQGDEIVDATDTDLGRAYQQLHFNATKKGHCYVATVYDALEKAQLGGDKRAYWDREVKPMGLLMTTRPELGDVRKLNVDEVVKFCADASKFGRDGETVFDSAVRQSREHIFTPEEITQVNPIITKAAVLAAKELLGLKREKDDAKLPFHLEMDKIVAYQVGDHFDEHLDTVRGINHIGTVVLTLDTKFKGGQLIFPSERVESSYAEAVAFFTDVRHLVSKVTSGTRVSITFRLMLDDENFQMNIFNESWDYDEDDDGECTHDNGNDNVVDVADQSDIPHLPGTEEYWDAIAAPVRKRLCQRANTPFANSKFVKKLRSHLRAGKKCVLGCVHRLPAAALASNNALQNLRGIDKAVAANIVALGDFTLSLVTLRVEYTRWPENYSRGEATRKVFAFPTNEIFEKMNFYRPGALEAVLLKSNQGAEHTGNESAPAEYTYICVGMCIGFKDPKMADGVESDDEEKEEVEGNQD